MLKMIIPLDGSHLSERALDSVEQIARQPGAELQVRLVRVMAYPAEVATGGLGYVPPITEDLIAQDTHIAQEYLTRMAQRLETPGVTTSTVVGSGQPAAVIIEAAREQGADLIVMASHGRTGLARMALGSVATEVVRQAHIPVLVVRAGTTVFPSAARSEPFTVLVPLDGSSLAEASIPAAMSVAQLFKGALRLFAVLANEVERSEQRQQRQHEKLEYLARIAEPIERQSIPVHRAIAWGDAAEQIALEVERYPTDLIALATHGRVGFDRLVNGSVAEAVLQHSPVPVLIVHPAPQEQETRGWPSAAAW